LLDALREELRKRNYLPITTCGWHKRNCAYADMPAGDSRRRGLRNLNDKWPAGH
jgi:hypothetical protein